MRRTPRTTRGASVAGSVLALLLITPSVFADDRGLIRASLNEDEIGYREYRQYCGICHGLLADGKGLAAPILKTVPTNLRTLSERHGKPFPRQKLRDFIDGRPPLSHGSREMPIWGRRLGEGYPSQTPEMNKRNIINSILNYLESIQSHSPADAADD